MKDTRELQRLIKENPADIGIRQLHLHWLDQLQYRKQYADAIAHSADVLLAYLNQLPEQTPGLKSAKAFSLYRLGRALAYRELPEVVEDDPIADPQQHDARLRDAYQRLVDLVGAGRVDFVLLDVRMLRRNGWYGQALGVLEDHARVISPKWLLKKRRDLLQELQWDAPYREAAAIFAREYPEEVERESSASQQG